MRPDKNNTQASDSELVDEKIYPLCPSQKAETAVPEYEQIDWEAEQNQVQPERWQMVHPVRDFLVGDQLWRTANNSAPDHGRTLLSRCTKLGDWRALSFEGISSFSTIFHCT